MRKTSKSPSEWLRLLCRDWAIENEDIVLATDFKFIGYKSYLKGRLSSQLLCRLSIPEIPLETETSPIVSTRHIDFWGVLGIEDDFDKSYIVSQIERFCALYSIRSIVVDDDLIEQPINNSEADASMVMQYSVAGVHYPTYLNGIGSTKDPRYITADQRDVKNRQREAVQMRKVADRAARSASREEKRQNKLKLRQSREQAVKQQKEAALTRAAELVKSNRVPIEITRGAAAAQAAANAAVAMMGVKPDEEDESDSKKRQRSDIVVSTASDLDRIVTHAKNLWTKYNAIAKEHNRKVNWSTVSKELGIHVKVREKYARMHARALQRGFDFNACGKFHGVSVMVNLSTVCKLITQIQFYPAIGHFKIKEHPLIFLEPLAPQQKMSVALNREAHHHEESIVYDNKDMPDEQHHISDDQVAAAVDAAIKTVPAPDVNCYDDAAATVDEVMNATTNGNGVDLSVSNATQAALAVGSEHVVNSDHIQI